jgi:ubiquitin C-terminal hydrolase
LYAHFIGALSAIVSRDTTIAINYFFNLIRDFQGTDNRYGQIAVSDFLEYLGLKLADLFDQIRFECISKLQCLNCKWVSYQISKDLLFKLYIPPTHTHCTLTDLLDYNTTVSMRDNSIFCGRCSKKTDHYLTAELVSNFVILEVIRVSDAKGSGSFFKNNIPISFPTSGISIPGCRSKYQVVATCHHRGTLNSGHWFVKLKTANQTWWVCDDLRPTNSVTNPPGTRDSSVVLLFLVAEPLAT